MQRTEPTEDMIAMAREIGERNTGTFTVHPEHGVRALDDEVISLIRQSAINAALLAIQRTSDLAAGCAEEMGNRWHVEWRADHKSNSHTEGKSDGADEISTAFRTFAHLKGQTQ